MADSVHIIDVYSRTTRQGFCECTLSTCGPSLIAWDNSGATRRNLRLGSMMTSGETQHAAMDRRISHIYVILVITCKGVIVAFLKHERRVVATNASENRHNLVIDFRSSLTLCMSTSNIYFRQDIELIAPQFKTNLILAEHY